MADTSPPKASEETVRQLADLGLTWDLLWKAIETGEKERQEVTEFDPVPAGGLKDWIARVGTLRSQLKGQGWNPVDNHHIPLSVNASKTIGVGVLLGDSYTGWQGKQGPRSKYEKGSQVLKAGKDNALLMRSDLRSDQLDKSEFDRLQKWFLVTYRHICPVDTRKPGGLLEAEVLSELSLPGPSKSSTYIDSWLDRIRLPPTRFALPNESAGDDGDGMEGLSGVM